MVNKIENIFNKYKYLFLIIFIVIFWLVRSPEFRIGWDWQDSNGHDTDIFVNQPSYPNYFLIDRINGQNNYFPPTGHPGTIYALFSLNGSLVKTIAPLNTMTDQEVVTFLKVMVTAVHLLIYACLGWYILKRIKPTWKRIIALGILVVLANSPIALYNTNEFQIDSYLGVIMVACLCFTLLPFLETPQIIKRWHYILLALAAAFIGLGKNEWSLMLIASIIAILILYFVINKIIPKQPSDPIFIKMLIVIFCGNLIGNLCSFIFNRDLYLSGLELLSRMTQNVTIHGSNGSTWFQVMVTRLPYISTIFVLLLALMWMFFRKFKNINYYKLFIFIYGFFLFFAFFISSWGDFSRYFAPALMVLTVAFFIYYRDFKLDNILKMILIILVVLVSFQSFTLFKSIWSRSKNDTYFSVTTNTSDNCVPLLDVGIVYRRPNIDFVHLGMGYVSAESIVEAYGKHMCK